MTEADERLLTKIRANPLKTMINNQIVEYESEKFLLRLLDEARAENTRIMAMLRDPPEDVIEALNLAFLSASGRRNKIRAILSMLTGKIAEG